MRKALAAAALLLLLVGAAVCLVSCGTSPPPPSGVPGPPNTVRVSGAWALYPMMLRWAEEYQKLHPDVQVGVWAGGSTKGASDALGGVVDIGMISRSIHPEEEKQGGFWVPAAKEAVAKAKASGRNRCEAYG